MNKHPDPIDLEVGRRLRAQRKLAGISQQALAEAVGITFQQVQKYENGTNRISMSRLVRMAEVLGIDPVVLIPRDDAPAPGGGILTELAGVSGGVRLAQVFIGLTGQQRAALVGMVESFAQAA